MARVKQLADKDGEPIYPVVDPTQLHFSGNTDQVVRGDGSIGQQDATDITNYNGTILNLVKGIYPEQSHTWICKTDGGSANIPDKPTGTTNHGFVLTAEKHRDVSSSDYHYVLTCKLSYSNDIYVTYVQNTDATLISWKKIITSSSVPLPSPSPTTVTNFGNITSTATKTMAADGFITGKAITFASGEQAWVELDGIMVGGIPYSSFGGNIQVAFCVPVKKNSTVRFVVNGQGVFQQVKLQGYRY